MVYFTNKQADKNGVKGIHMKKLLALLLCSLLLVSAAACAAKNADDPNVIVGRLEPGPRWENAKTAELPDDVEAIFWKAIGEVAGVSYRPFALLGTEVQKEKTYYCILTQCTAVMPDAKPAMTLMFISVDAEGNAELVNGAEMPIVPNEGGTRPMTPTEAAAGGWSYAEDPAISDEMALRFYEAVESLSGASYEPLVNVGTQVVAGLNRCILCRVTPDEPGTEPRYAFVYVWEKLDGTTELLEPSYDFTYGDLCVDGE